MKKKFINIIPLKYRIKSWFWWNFQATTKDKLEYDMLVYGTAISKNGKRVNPKKLLIKS